MLFRNRMQHSVGALHSVRDRLCDTDVDRPSIEFLSLPHFPPFVLYTIYKTGVAQRSLKIVISNAAMVSQDIVLRHEGVLSGQIKVLVLKAEVGLRRRSASSPYRDSVGDTRPRPWTQRQLSRDRVS